jgi:hypothetical protein
MRRGARLVRTPISPALKSTMAATADFQVGLATAIVAVLTLA